MSNIIYLGYYFKVKPLQPAVEILIAELGYAGFESFVETEEGVTAYIQKDTWNNTILAELKGAKPIDAVDFDNWCYLNSIENVERNNCNHITVIEGDASVLKHKYDIIIANINRNILMQDMATYVSCLNKGGMLFLSGFYSDDIPMIQAACEKQLLKFEEKLERNNWVSLKFLH